MKNMKRTVKSLVALMLLIAMLVPAFSASACDVDLYVVQSMQPYGYTYLYSNPSDRDGISLNLGRYDNGSCVYMLDHNGGKDGKFRYCLVMTEDGQVGFMHDYALVSESVAVLDYWCSDAPEYVVDSRDPYGYCYLYSKGSDITGTNLGRYDNGETVKVLCRNAAKEGRFVYSLVITQDNLLGYVHDYAIRPIW